MITATYTNHSQARAVSRMLTLVLIALGPVASAAAEPALLDARDLPKVAGALLANQAEGKKYLGRTFKAEGKYRSGPVQGTNLAEIEFADFAVAHGLRGTD